MLMFFYSGDYTAEWCRIEPDMHDLVFHILVYILAQEKMIEPLKQLALIKLMQHQGSVPFEAYSWAVREVYGNIEESEQVMREALVSRAVACYENMFMGDHNQAGRALLEVPGFGRDVALRLMEMHKWGRSGFPVGNPAAFQGSKCLVRMGP